MSKLGELVPRVHSVLVVDDDDDIRESLRDLLEAHLPEARIVACPDGPAALAAMEDEHFDAILSDYKMPGMDGLTFLANARQKQEGAARILLTAYPELNVARQAIEDAAISNFLTKPISPETLLEALNAAVFKAHQNRAFEDAFEDAPAAQD